MKPRSVVFALALAVSCAAPALSAEQVPTLRYGREVENNRSLSNLPFFVAQKKGFFAKEGVNVVVVEVPAAITTAEAFAAGRVPTLEAEHGVDMTRINVPYLIEAVSHGADVVGVVGETANPVYSLIARPEITSFADLKGKLVGMSAPADTITVTSRKLMALHGVNAGDFQVRRIRGTGPRYDCLKTGDCVAVPLGQPQDIIAVNAGYRRLGTSHEVGAVVFDVDVVQPAWARDHKDTVVRYARGIASAMRFLNDPANRAETAALIRELTGESPEIAMQLTQSYVDPVRRMLPRQAEIDMAGLRNVIALMGEANALAAPLPAAERFVDLTYLTAAGLQ